MSNRPAIKSAFEGLRPSIVREPSRSVIAPQDESKLLDTAAPSSGPEPVSPAGPTSITTPDELSFSTTVLLKKKRREVLVPVTFRIPQTLKERLNEIAKRHELNQTDLINEGIELNLQRYR
jgi:hypothetical protein